MVVKGSGSSGGRMVATYLNASERKDMEEVVQGLDTTVYGYLKWLILRDVKKRKKAAEISSGGIEKAKRKNGGSSKLGVSSSVRRKK